MKSLAVECWCYMVVHTVLVAFADNKEDKFRLYASGLQTNQDSTAIKFWSLYTPQKLTWTKKSLKWKRKLSSKLFKPPILGSMIIYFRVYRNRIDLVSFPKGCAREERVQGVLCCLLLLLKVAPATGFSGGDFHYSLTYVDQDMSFCGIQSG